MARLHRWLFAETTIIYFLVYWYTAWNALGNRKMSKKSVKTVIPTIVVSNPEQVKAIGKVIQVFEASNVKLRLRENAGQFQLTQSFQEKTRRGSLYWARETILSTHTNREEGIVAFLKSAHQITSQLVAGIE